MQYLSKGIEMKNHAAMSKWSDMTPEAQRSKEGKRLRKNALKFAKRKSAVPKADPALE